MTWLALTETMLLEQVSADELDLWRKAGLGAGQTDPVAGMLATVTAEVRGFVGKVAALDADTTKIPISLKSVALDIVCYRLAARVGSQVTPERKAAAERGWSRLSELSGREFTLTPAGAWGSKERLNLPPNDSETEG